MAVDLHLHTTHSDGSYTPAELVDYVKKFDVTVMAVTDHDDISGVPEAMAYAGQAGVSVVPGIELSIDYPLQGRAHLHLLGLFIDIKSTALLDVLRSLRQARRTRAAEILERLRAQKIDVTFEELQQEVSGKSIGRPHIARLLVRKGLVQSIPEAFEKFLGRGAPAFVPKKKMGLQQAIHIIHQARGLAILAHPVSLFAKDYRQLTDYLDRFRAVGLDGLEAYYSYHSEQLTEFLLRYAEEHHLAVSGGSDFHGRAKPDIQPAIGTGNLHIPLQTVSALLSFYKGKYQCFPKTFSEA